MSPFFRRFIPLIIILFLLAACTAPAGNSNVTPQATAPGTALATAPSTPSAGTASDVCPAPLQHVRNCLTPHALRVAYGVQSLIEKGFTGKGQTVIDIVSFGSPTLKQDMEYYNKIMGLPPVDLEVISPLKVPEYDPNHDKAGWAAETTLDVQIIHAIAPDAKIIVLTSPVAETQGTIGLPEFRQLIQYAIDHKLGNIFSQSWGASELTLQDQAGQQELQKWNEMLQKATTQQGMTFFSSSGDHGATDFADLESKKIANVPTTSFACDSPWVTAVGGTTLISPTKGLRETAWDGSGGGFSRFYQTPDYQKLLPASVQQQLNNRRGVPDVSAVADPRTGLAMYQDGQWGLAGGTSASAPVWAGLMAIANQMAGRPLGFINPTLYKIATSSKYTQDFRDITVGNNTNTDGGTTVTGYPAVTGWDPVTGLGAPIADKLIPDLVAMAKS